MEQKQSNIPKITNVNNELIIEGEFEFTPSRLTLDNGDLVRYITFKVGVDVKMSDVLTFGEDEVNELISEKLKQDFKKYMKDVCYK